MDFLVNHHENESLNLIRYIADEAKNKSSVVYIFPINLRKQISLQAIRSVLYELEEKGHIEILQKPNYDLTDKQRQKREDEEDYYFIEVKETFYDYLSARELTAEVYTPMTSAIKDKNPLNEIEAELSFVSITIPIVKIGEMTYRQPAMRDGLPFNIVSYCLRFRPNKTMKIEDLRSEMKVKGFSASGLTNIREHLRKSAFGEHMPLSAFVVASSSAIIVRTEATITKNEFNVIQAESNKS